MMTEQQHRRIDQIGDRHPWDRDAAQICFQPPKRFAFLLVKCLNHGSSSQHFHWSGGPKHHANFILAGNAQYRHEDGRELQLGPGDCYQHPPGQQGWLSTCPGSDFIEFYLVLDVDQADALQTMGIVPKRDLIRGGDTALFVRHFERLHAFARQSEHLPRSTFCCRLACLLDDCFRDLISSSRRSSPHAEAVRQATELLSQAAWDRRPLPELAAHLGLSYATLRRSFTAIEGISLVHYRLVARLQRAAHLLLDGASVEASASATGYAEPFTFSQQFKQVFGVAPSEYQQRYRF